MEGRVKLGIELKISYSDTMLNYRLSQKFKMLGNSEFNHLIISLTFCWLLLLVLTFFKKNTKIVGMLKDMKNSERCGVSLGN